MEYGPKHAQYYDLMFTSRGKDFAHEAQSLVALIASRTSEHGTLLDVACGTGAHLEHLAGAFDHVEGLDSSADMREVAGRRLPDVTLHDGDMRTFNLHEQFDAVTCMGNAVGELASTAELDQAMANMAGHLSPGGVLVVEPWYFPENFLDGYVGGHLHRDGDRIITRLTHSVRDGDQSRMTVRFQIADASGFTDFEEELVSSLFTRAQYEAAFKSANCLVEFLPGFSLAGGRRNSPGLFLAIRLAE